MEPRQFSKFAKLAELVEIQPIFCKHLLRIEQS